MKGQARAGHELAGAGGGVDRAALGSLKAERRAGNWNWNWKLELEPERKLAAAGKGSEA
jgi:hypothetical protein